MLNRQDRHFPRETHLPPMDAGKWLRGGGVPA